MKSKFEFFLRRAELTAGHIDEQWVREVKPSGEIVEHGPWPSFYGARTFVESRKKS